VNANYVGLTNTYTFSTKTPATKRVFWLTNDLMALSLLHPNRIPIVVLILAEIVRAAAVEVHHPEWHSKLALSAYNCQTLWAFEDIPIARGFGGDDRAHT
jgi:hypothetical protein